MKKFFIYLATAALAFSTTSCELDFEPEGGVYTNEQIQALVNEKPEMILGPFSLGLVTAMRGYQMWNFTQDLQGNDLVLYKINSHNAGIYQFNNLRTSRSGFAHDKWGLYYSVIYKAHQLLAIVPENASKEVLPYKGVGLTFRGMAYYYLMTLFQDDFMNGGKDKLGVPIYTYEGQPAQGRATSVAVYQQILSDLEEAVKCFQDAGYNPMKQRDDVDQTVAAMFLARAALTCGEYQKAIDAADIVINAGYSFMRESDYVTTISADGVYKGHGFQDITLPETVMGYKHADIDGSSPSSFVSYMSCWGDTAYASVNTEQIYTGMDKRLCDMIPATDYRKKNFMSADVKIKGDETKIIKKYVNTKFAYETLEADMIYLRLSEAYLLKAEAQARKALAEGGSYDAAQSTLFTLVSQRDSGYRKSTRTGEDLLEEIFFQSRVELWGEGHEYFTNKRFNVGVNRLGDETVTNHPDHTILPEGKDFTYQIPEQELQQNPHIKENNPL